MAQPKPEANNWIVVEDDDDFTAKVNANKASLVIVDFGATWCNPCKELEPILKAASQKYPNVIFLKVDADECSDSSDDFGVQSLPTIIVLKNGAKVDSKVGMQQENDIDALIQQHLAK